MSAFLWALLTLILLLFGFTACSSLAGQISENHWWLLGVGLSCCFILPAVLASWFRGLQQGRHTSSSTDPSAPSAAPRVRFPSTLQAVASLNTLLLLGCVLVAPGMTREALNQRGSWWVAQIADLAGAKPDSPVVITSEEIIRQLSSLLPDGVNADDPPSTASDGGAPGESEEAGAPGPPLIDAGHTGSADSTGSPPAEIRINYKKRGSGVVVPVVLHGDRGQISVKMLFDTGASLSTIDRATLNRLGYSLSYDDPKIKTHTANGVVQRPIKVIEGIDLDLAHVRGGLTVSVCDPCAQGKVVGLLGLNFTRHFKVTLDHEAGQIVLNPKHDVDHLTDIRPFISLERAKGIWRGPHLKVSMVLKNRAPRALRNIKVGAVIEAEGKEHQIWGEVEAVPARSSQPVKIEGLLPIKGNRFTLKILGASW